MRKVPIFSLTALLLAPMVVRAGDITPVQRSIPARQQGSTLFNPAEPYDVNLPVYPVTYSEEQQQAQRAAGLALVKEVNEAMRSRKPEYRAKPGIYRLPKGVNFVTRDIDRFALHLPDCELILEPVPDRHLFSFGRAKSFTLTGPLKVDYDPLPESQGRIVAADFATKRVTVAVRPGYHALTPKISDKKSSDKTREEERFYTYSPSGVWLPNMSWSGFSWNDAVLAADGRTVTFTAGKGVASKLWEELYQSNNLVSLGMAGCGVLFCIWPDQLGELTVQDLDFYGGGFGWGNATGETTLTRVRGLRRPGTNRLQGGGGWQSGKREGRVTLDSCEFRTTYDDILDLSSGSMDMVWQQAGPRQLVIWSADSHHYEQDKAGDAFIFYDKSFIPVTDAKLLLAERIPNEQAKPWVQPAAELVRTKLHFKDHTGGRAFWRLTLDKDLTLEPGTLVEDLANRQMEVVMRNCVWYDCGVRAMIQSGRRIEITNNTFVRVASGLWVSTDAWWWQGETVHNVVIANNLFVDCSYGSLWGSGNAAITVHNGIKPIASFPGRYPNSDIVIRDNRIEGSSSGGIMVQNSDHVQITGNECRRLFQRKTHAAAIAVSGSAHVTITGNRIQDCPASAIKADWVDGLECSANTASHLGTAGKRAVMVDLDHVRQGQVQGNTADQSQLDAVVRLMNCSDLKSDRNAASDSPATPAVKDEMLNW
ncbi:MAG: right-handed parallel beta-helix repeat-containing protein [Verrucomicrobiota bacterium]